MERNMGGVVAVVVVCFAIYAVKDAVNRNKQDPAKVREEAKRKQDEERERKLSDSETAHPVDDPDEDFSIIFPSKPSKRDVFRIGAVVGIDHDRDLIWDYDTTYAVRCREVGVSKDDRAYVKQARQDLIDHEHAFRKGRPVDWVIGEQKEYMFLDQFPAAEFVYEYKKFTHMEARSGRVMIVKVPKQLYYLHVDGPPDVLAAPVTQRFFGSFLYFPKDRKKSAPKSK